MVAHCRERSPFRKCEKAGEIPHSWEKFNNFGGKATLEFNALQGHSYCAFSCLEDLQILLEGLLLTGIETCVCIDRGGISYGRRKG